MSGRRTVTNAALPSAADHAGGRVHSLRLPAAALAAVGILAWARLPPGPALAAASALLVGGGLALAAGTYCSRTACEGRGGRDYAAAGLLVFLGFAAALVSDGDAVLMALEEMEGRGLAALDR